jgi:hypothetical protein
LTPTRRPRSFRSPPPGSPGTELRGAGPRRLDDRRDDVLDGDIIVVEKRSHAHNGETVVVSIQSDQATLNKLYVEAYHICL